MQRTKLNTALDASAALLFLIMIATGFVIQFALPPGSGRVWKLWGLARHDWSRLHALVSVALLLVIVAHVAVHWKWVVQVANRRLGGAGLSERKAAILTLAALPSLFAIFALATLSTREPTTAEDLTECIPAPAAAVAVAAPDGGAPSYRDVEPLLRSRCLRCHQEGRAAGGVRLDGYEQTVIHVVSRSPEQSRLIRSLTLGADAAHQVDPAALELLQRWVRQGAER